MACVMFMWGALVGSPGWLGSTSTSASRSQAALPGSWNPAPDAPTTSAAAAAALAKPHHHTQQQEQWQPNCMRVLHSLPDSDSDGDGGGGGSSLKKSKREPLLVVSAAGSEDTDVIMDHQTDSSSSSSSSIVVPTIKKIDGNDAASSAISNHNNMPQYSYVLCRDTKAALDNVKACSKRMRAGLPCGQPHTISLILPASAAGLDDTWDGTHSENDSSPNAPGQLDLAEVQCSITAVAKIPSSHHSQQYQTAAAGAATAQGAAHQTASKYGRVIATVPETGTAVIG